MGLYNFTGSFGLVPGLSVFFFFLLPLKNLAKDYWSSMYFMKFKEEASMRSNGLELEQMTGLNFSPRLSSVHGADDPFHQEHFSKGSANDSHDSDTMNQEL